MPTWFFTPIAGFNLPTRYDNPFPSRFVAPIDYFQIPALVLKKILGLFSHIFSLFLVTNTKIELLNRLGIN
jgi:hypothetical protein